MGVFSIRAKAPVNRRSLNAARDLVRCLGGRAGVWDRVLFGQVKEPCQQ